MSDALEDLKAQYNSISDDDIEDAVYEEVENDASDDALGDDEVDSELDDSEDDSEDSPPGFKSYAARTRRTTRARTHIKQSMSVYRRSRS
jgi:hypothetical protein